VIMTGATWDEVWPIVRDHHYLHRRTADPMFCFACRDPGGLLGDTGPVRAAMVLTSPANRYFGARSVELARLVREPDVTIPMSKFIGWVMRWLKANTDLAYCLSYADTGAGHHGGVYQAANFTYVATTNGNVQYRNPETGQVVSGRAYDQRRSAYQNWERLKTSQKFLYVFPLSERRDKLLNRFGWQALPYPKPHENEERNLR